MSDERRFWVFELEEVGLKGRVGVTFYIDPGSNFRLSGGQGSDHRCLICMPCHCHATHFLF